MTHFLLDILVNLALLAGVSLACGLYNRLGAGATLSGPRVFAALAAIALVLDIVLTFVVFADAQSRYGQFSRTATFFQRSGAYVLAIMVAFAWHYVARRRRSTKLDACKTIVISTSPYSESRLRI
ncbi:hypothetical protein GXB81_15185 [Paraburkholderia sp. Ac-20336]|uniref:hypothetical protein n=1 Tax=Burkholderiaceae TaxID=119060 RepID=UPI00141F2D75|nr:MULTISPECIES: hypothetical protein [Burkholderiaceae]MBN3804383.1 hypothetical protein [Paraburkholderia sp. Ac-20336]MBN3847180.1 hypothetical protein [Paraburkholderia sp. Ac-20342]NIF50605.1 hypothetical protein [Burkholderia sp. Ax-1724]